MASSCLRLVLRSANSNFPLLATKPYPVAAGAYRQASHAVTYDETLTIPETKVTTLKNLLRVASEESNAGVATVGLWINSGSRYEYEAKNGVAHLIQHMAFKGTAKQTQTDIEAEAERLGMYLSAHTTREQLILYATCLSKDVPRAVEILADIVQNPKLSEADIENEKKVIMREFQEIESDQSAVVMDYLHATAYQGTGLSRSVYGNTQSLKSITRKDMTDFISNYIKPPRMVLAAAGGVKHDDLVRLGEKLFSGMSLNYEYEIPTQVRPRFTGSEIRARDDDLPLAHVAMAIETPGCVHQDYVALQVAATIVGSWDKSYAAGKNLSIILGSRCAQEEMCQSYRSFNIGYSDTGLWGAHFVADRHTIEDFMFNLQGQWMRLCSSATEFEVERARKQLKTELHRQLASTTLVCDDIGRQVLYYDRRVPLLEMDERIDAVNAKTVRDVCMKYVYDKCPAVASIGPVEQLPDYNRIRGSMYWLRL